MRCGGFCSAVAVGLDKRTSLELEIEPRAVWEEGERTVLDNSMVLFCSALSDGNKHNPDQLPFVLAGGGGGRLAGGQHLVYAEDTPVANLYVSMLEAFGTPVERFVDSVGPLRGVLS